MTDNGMWEVMVRGRWEQSSSWSLRMCEGSSPDFSLHFLAVVSKMVFGSEHVVSSFYHLCNKIMWHLKEKQHKWCMRITFKWEAPLFPTLRIEELVHPQLFWFECSPCRQASHFPVDVLFVLLKEFILSCCKIYRVYVAFSLVQNFKLIIEGTNKTPIGFFFPKSHYVLWCSNVSTKRYIIWIFSC